MATNYTTLGETRIKLNNDGKSVIVQAQEVDKDGAISYQLSIADTYKAEDESGKPEWRRSRTVVNMVVADIKTMKAVSEALGKAVAGVVTAAETAAKSKPKAPKPAGIDLGKIDPDMKAQLLAALLEEAKASQSKPKSKGKK